jgi:hypothetical protein
VKCSTPERKEWVHNSMLLKESITRLSKISAYFKE